MNNTFEFVSKLSIGKESATFKPYEVTTSNGWTTTKLLYNAIAGDNRHMLESKGLHKADGTGSVYTFSKGGVDPNTKEKIKGEKLEISWNKRNNPEEIEQVAEFKKFVVDLEEPKRRYTLEKALEKFKEGSLTDEELQELKVDDLEKAVEDSKKKRREFIHETDFTTYVYKLISSGKYSDRMFRVLGEIVYSEYDGRFRETLSPSRIYLVEKDATPSSIGNINIFFKKDCVEEVGDKVFIKGYAGNYDNKRKANIYAPIVLTIDKSKDSEDEKKAKLNKLFQSQFTVKDKTWKEIGVKVIMLNGSQKKEITEDMLNDFQKEMLEMGSITLDDIRAELGGDVYGKPVKAMIVDNVSKGYSKGRKDTMYQDSNFVVKPLEIKSKEVKQEETNDEDEEDIFAEFNE